MRFPLGFSMVLPGPRAGLPGPVLGWFVAGDHMRTDQNSVQTVLTRPPARAAVAGWIELVGLHVGVSAPLRRLGWKTIKSPNLCPWLPVAGPLRPVTGPLPLPRRQGAVAGLRAWSDASGPQLPASAVTLMIQWWQRAAVLHAISKSLRMDEVPNEGFP